MIIKNYPQFSKKTFLMAVDKKYFMCFVVVQAPIYFIFLFTFSAIVSMGFTGGSYLLSVIAFAKNNYILEKIVISLVLRINNILPR